jgi:hypothetical protein
MAAILVEIFARNDQLLWLERTHKLAAAAASLVSWLVESLLAGVYRLSMNRTRHVDRFVQAFKQPALILTFLTRPIPHATAAIRRRGRTRPGGGDCYQTARSITWAFRSEG